MDKPSPAWPSRTGYVRLAYRLALGNSIGEVTIIVLVVFFILLTATVSITDFNVFAADLPAV